METLGCGVIVKNFELCFPGFGGSLKSSIQFCSYFLCLFVSVFLHKQVVTSDFH